MIDFAAEIARLEQMAAGITDELKEPMSDLERALLAGDRRDIRARIAQLKARLNARATAIKDGKQ
jgi:hypothetical protein